MQHLHVHPVPLEKALLGKQPHAWQAQLWRVLWYAAQTSMQAKPGKTLRVGDSYKVVDSSNRSAFVLIGVRVLLRTV